MKNRQKAVPVVLSGGLVLVLVTFSGALGLSYEVLWARLLALAAGHTLGAMSTVAATFMGGLALVRARVGRADGAARLAWLYAANSLGGAAGALAVTFGLLPVLGHRATGWLLAATGAATGTVALRRGRGDGAVAHDPAPLAISHT